MKKQLVFFLITLISIASVFCLNNCSKSNGSVVSNKDHVDFNFQIRPILSDRCFQCHGPDANKREADLRLDIEEYAYAALKDSPKEHAIVPFDPDSSVVYQLISTDDSTRLMPPIESNLKLTKEEIELIKKWISQGAKYDKHWAFKVPVKQEAELNGDWPTNEIDYFVSEKLKQEGLKPNEEADKRALLKRVSYDLTGLPPTQEIQAKFLNDDSDKAYENLVDELLESKNYGEQMALDWLDVARYADSHGYQDDGLRTMWPWRDWVIHAFNENYSYKKFVTWQLAGDLLPDANKESVLATGFNRNHKITQEGGVIDEEYRINYVTDRTNTFGKSFLAMTYECSHCHDHKYDPISQKEYYQTFAFFNQVPEKGLFGTIDASFADPPNIKISKSDVEGILNFINKKDTADVAVMVMEDDKKRRPTYFLERGNYDEPGPQVSFGLPLAILEYDTSKYQSNRLGLSNWLFDSNNPLTARVYVNRLWQKFFGQGIVKTVGDFGMQGDLPSHPELLDWLSVDFMENDWDIKKLIKKMLMSSTYRQSSTITNEHLKKDPNNVYLARAARKRMPAENIRDMVLSTSNLLTNEIGGPSIKPYQPEGIWEVASSGRGLLKNYVQDHGKDLYKRGIYVFIKRTVPPPAMLIYDASNRDQCEVLRTSTNTPLQALVMLNDPLILEASRVMAGNLMENKQPIETKIDQAFETIIGRPASKKEIKLLEDYYDEQEVLFQKEPKKINKVLHVGESPVNTKVDKTKTAALSRVIQVIYNMEEAIVKV